MKKRILFLMVMGSITINCSSGFFDQFKKIVPESESFLSLEHAVQRPHYSSLQLSLVHEKFIVGQADLVAAVGKLYDCSSTTFFVRKSKFVKDAQAIMRSGERYDPKKMTEDPEWYEVPHIGELERLQLDGTAVVQIFLKL